MIPFFLHPFLVGAEKRFSFGCKFPGIIVYLFEIRTLESLGSFNRRKRLGSS